MINQRIVLCEHFDISPELFDEIADKVVYSEAWQTRPDAVLWDKYNVGAGPKPTTEQQHDLIDWLAIQFQPYLKLKIFL